MQETHTACMNCARADTRVPLVQLRFHERTLYICPQCLPALIHHPERLAEKLAAFAGGEKQQGTAG